MMKVVQLQLNVGPKNLWTKCPECEGSKEAILKINEKNIAELCDMDSCVLV
jgi:hypothetical protein